MTFIHVRGPAKTEGFPKVASTAIALASALAFDIEGRVAQARAVSTRIAGISGRKIASTDDDYASNTLIPLIIPSSDDVFEATVSGTAVQAHVGQAFDLTQTNGGTAQAVDLAAQSYKVVTVVKFINSSTVQVKFNGNYAYSSKAN